MTNPLQNRIQEWKHNLKLNGVYTEEQLLELEDHLHSQLDRLLSEGKSEETAFAEASLAIGHPVALGRAYSLNNKHLILKYLGVYFLLGFPIIQAFLMLFEYSWKIPGSFLLLQGFRGTEVIVGIYLGPTLLLAMLLYLFISKPFWLTNLVKKLSKQFYGTLLVLIGFGTWIFHWIIQYTYNWSMSNSHHFIHKQHYNLFTKVAILMSYQLFAIAFLGILISIILKATLAPGSIGKIISKAKLLMLMAGYFIIEKFIRGFSIFKAYSIDNINEYHLSRSYYILYTCIICFTLASFLIRTLYRKRRNLVLD